MVPNIRLAPWRASHRLNKVGLQTAPWFRLPHFIAATRTVLHIKASNFIDQRFGIYLTLFGIFHL
jgi:hypothetical protein